MIFTLCKNVINDGSYEYQSMLNKIDVYLLGNRIGVDQYTVLKNIMDAQQAVE